MIDVKTLYVIVIAGIFMILVFPLNTGIQSERVTLCPAVEYCISNGNDVYWFSGCSDDIPEGYSYLTSDVDQCVSSGVGGYHPDMNIVESSVKEYPKYEYFEMVKNKQIKTASDHITYHLKYVEQSISAFTTNIVEQIKIWFEELF